MDAKSLKKLNRRELLEVMVQISEQNETLEQENEVLKSQLNDRKLSAKEVGTLAHAALDANGYFLSADKAAKQYLENVVRLEEETKLRCSRLLEETLEECIRLRAQAGVAQDQLVPSEWAAGPEAATGVKAAASNATAVADGTVSAADAGIQAAANGEAEISEAVQTASKKKKGLFRRNK